MAEIKISELSIGDWVEIDGAATKVWYLSQDSEVNDTTYDWVEPIPLTPEILEKNGCLHTAENRILCDWFDGRITVRKYNNREWYELFVGSNQMKFKLMFVHQLQHALRLAGIEKEIEV
jgi:hypothetical protein